MQHTPPDLHPILPVVFIEPNSVKSVPFTTSEVIASHVGLQHHTITRVLRKHRNDFEQFGILGFKIQEINGRGQPERIYHLNESQATLLMAYLKNTEVVRAFKVELVRQFYAMRNELAARELERAKLTPVRRSLTDAIRDQPDAGKWDYRLYTDLSYKIATGKTASQLRKERGASPKAIAADFLTSDELAAVTAMQNRIAVLIDTGMAYEAIKNLLHTRYAHQ